MSTKLSVVFFVAFVALLSIDYATATFFGKYSGVSKTYAKGNDGYYGWSSGCRCNKHLTSQLDGVLDRWRHSLATQFKSGCSIQDTSLEEYEFTKGQLKGFHKFERNGPYRCSLSRGYVRIFFKIRFFELYCHYYVSLVKTTLGGFLGGVASFIGRILGSVTNFFFQIVVPDLYCTVVLMRNFGGRGGFQLEGFYLNEIEKISFQDKRFSKHKSSFESYFRPLCDHVLRHTFTNKFSGVLTEHVTKVSAERDSFYYESSSKKSSGGNYEESDESESDDSTKYTYESSDSEYSYD